jgi:hypothetical protein
MRLNRKVLLAGAVLTLPIATIAATGSSAWGKGATNGTGTVTCHLTGAFTFKPALVNGGTAPEHAKLKITLSGCTGGSPTPTSGSISSPVGAGETNSCSNVASTSGVTIKWKASSKINPTVMTFSSETGTTNSSGDVGFNLTGGSATGSYSGSGGSASVVGNVTLPQIVSACEGKGVKKLTIASGSLTTSS